MLTARTGVLDRIRGGIEGAVRYLTKPFDPVDLRDTLVEVLGAGPEPLQRRRAQQEALTTLARVEGGRPAPDPTVVTARPHLSRLDGAPISRARSSPPMVSPAQLESLSAKQRELIAAVAASPTVIEAADRLSVSRSNVYASLRRIARKLGVPTVSDLVTLARSGSLS